MMRDASYDDGIRAARVHTTARGKLAYDDGYYFMANDRVEGRTWTEVANVGSAPLTRRSVEALLPVEDLYRHRALEQLLARGRTTLSKRRQRGLALRPTLRASSRVVTSDGKCFRPVDVFRPHLFRYRPFHAHRPSTHRRPGASDWNSARMRHAYAVARDSA